MKEKPQTNQKKKWTKHRCCVGKKKTSNESSNYNILREPREDVTCTKQEQGSKNTEHSEDKKELLKIKLKFNLIKI